jgi:putative hemolysin
MLIWVVIQGVFVVALLALSGFFSSSETIFFSLDPLQIRRLERADPARGGRVSELLRRPTALLSSILIGNIIVNVFLSAVGFSLVERFAPGRGEQISIPVLTALLLFFGEIGPKRLGLAYAERAAAAYVPALAASIRLTAPLRWMLESISRAFQPLFVPRGRMLTDEEYETVLDISGEEGVLNADEWAMVKSVVRLEDLRAADVMTPRVDVEGIDLNDPPDDLVAAVRRSRYKYLVLYRENLDETEGFLDVRRFLLDPDHRLSRAVLNPFYLPESAPLNAALDQLQHPRRHAAVVVDEYGGTAGLLTRGDILEEISGEIFTEPDEPRPALRPTGPHAWDVDPHIRLEELNRKLKTSLRSESADRLSGWIAEQLGRLPRPRDVVEADGIRVTVLRTLRRRVAEARIEKTGGAR